MTDKNKTLPTIKGYMDFTSPENPGALAMEFATGKDNQGVTSSFSIPKTMGGWRAPDFVAAHPGAVDTAMSTAMGRAAIFATKHAARVKSFNAEYLDLVPVGESMVCDARVIGKRGKMEVVVEARIRDAKGVMLAKSSGVFELFELTIDGDVQRAAVAGKCDPKFLSAMQKVVNPA